MQQLKNILVATLTILCNSSDILQLVANGLFQVASLWWSGKCFRESIFTHNASFSLSCTTLILKRCPHFPSNERSRLDHLIYSCQIPNICRKNDCGRNRGQKRWKRTNFGNLQVPAERASTLSCRNL